MIDAGIGWGDLLRVLAALPVAQREDAAQALGYALHPVALKAEPPAVVAEPAPPVANAVVVPVVAPPSAQQFWRVTFDLPDPQALTDAPDWFSQAEMPDDRVFESDPDVAAPPVAPLVSGPRLAPFLRRHLARSLRSGDTDVPRLLRHLTRHEPIRRWPVRERAQWPARVCVVLDTGQRLYPLDDDLRRIVTLLARLLGPRLVVLTTEQGLPQVPLDGRSAVVVLSDVGQGTGDAEAMSRWAAWGQRVARAGTRALLLAPLPGRLVRSELAQGFDLALLDDEPTPLRLVGRSGWRSVQMPAEPHDITPLRAALFGHTYVTPEVLRDLRRTLVDGGLALDVGSEQAVWQDTAVSGGATACMVRSDQREPVRAEFADEAVLSRAMRAAVVAVMWRHLQAASPFVRAEYARRLVGQFPPGHPWEAVLRAGVEAGDALAQRACVVMGRDESGEMAQSVAAYTARFGVRSLDLIDQGGDALQAAWLIAHRGELATGRVKPPTGLRLDRLAWLVRDLDANRSKITLQVPPLEQPGGVMLPESPFYVERWADTVAADEQHHAGYTLTIQAARQMGKSSLLGRVMQRAQVAGKQVAFVDFQSFGATDLADPHALYRQFCFLVQDSLGLDDELDHYWSVPLPPWQKATRFMEKRILPMCKSGGLLLALDEADALLDARTNSDFFGMLRSWHNKRALQPAWRHFALAVVSTEPYMLIDHQGQSPFNVGTTLRLEDFTLAESGQVNVSHGQVLGATELSALHELLGGHPYLMRKALYLLSKRRHTLTELMHEADSESGPFGDHLQALLVVLHTQTEFPAAMRSALQTGRVDDFGHRFRLIASGLLKESGRRLVVRNPLYEIYLARIL